MAPSSNTIHSALNYWATIYHLPLHHFAIAAPHHLHHTLRWQRPLCWPRYWCEDAVWQLKSFRWVGFEFSRQGGISLLDAFNIDFLSGLDANKVTPQQNKFFPKVRVCSAKIYLSKHCQRHNGPEGWVHITNLEHITISESQLSINFKHQHLD